MEREREGLFENPEWHIDSLYSLTPDRGLECNRLDSSVDVNFLFARDLTNRGLDLVNLREQRLMHGHLVCPARRSAVADAPITRAPRG